MNEKDSHRNVCSVLASCILYHIAPNKSIRLFNFMYIAQLQPANFYTFSF